MKQIDSFMKDGKVERSKIAIAIASGELTRDEIIELCKDSKMKSAFIGTSYSAKQSREKWDENYLDELVCVSVAESFNEDYLLYLNDVAEATRNRKQDKVSFPFGVIIGVATLFVVLFILVMIIRNNNR